MRRLLIPIAIVLLAACADSSSTAPSTAGTTAAPAAPVMNAVDRTVTREVDEGEAVFAGARVLACLGEPILIHYREQFALTLTTLPNGRLHAALHLNEMGSSAVGVNTGTRYRFMLNQSEADRVVDGGVYTETAIFMRRAVSQGSGPDFSVRNTYHITLNGQGELVIERIDSELDCR
jgi:hypothetical protein